MSNSEIDAEIESAETGIDESPLPLAAAENLPAKRGSARNLVLCLDGTSNGVAGCSTNVLRLYRSLTRGHRQITYYDSGVGTLEDPSKFTKFGQAVSQNIDMAIGHSVGAGVQRAYDFLVDTYRTGDRIFLFGFSRGAYSARALAGMLHWAGLVRRELKHLAQLAWTVYADKQFKACRKFRSSFANGRSIPIHFIGTWDTVSAFGWFANYKTLPSTSEIPNVCHVRHAVAIDENRGCFRENLYCNSDVGRQESFREIWFSGSHCDVGGGHPEHEDGPAKISLQWMFDEAREQGLHLRAGQVDYFLGRKNDRARAKQSAPSTQAALHRSHAGSWIWHLLEWVPRKQWDPARSKMRWYWPNLYRRRKIQSFNGTEASPSLHPSVFARLQSDPRYRPKNLCAVPEIRQWLDEGMPGRPDT